MMPMATDDGNGMVVPRDADGKELVMLGTTEDGDSVVGTFNANGCATGHLP